MTTPEILAEREKWERNAEKLKVAINALREVTCDVTIELHQLINRHIEASDKSRLLFEQLREAQKTCTHVWVDDGRDSHYDWRKCTQCGKTDRC